MFIITSVEKYFRRAREILDDILLTTSPERVGCFISSMGVYAGITKDGRDIRLTFDRSNVCANFLDYLNDKAAQGITTRLLIGCNPPTASQENWPELIRLRSHQEAWDGLEWKYINNHHLKCILFLVDYKIHNAIIGGRNLSSSRWRDVSWEVPNLKRDTLIVFNEAWSAASNLRSYEETVKLQWKKKEEVKNVFMF